MSRLKLISILAGCGITLAAVDASAAGDEAFADELLSLQTEFDTASFSALDKRARKDAFETLVQHAEDFSDRYPDRVEAVAWNGIVLSTYAGEVSALSAMKYAKAAKEALLEAESMEPTALDGGLYASLGALYSKVPGGMMGFGDDGVAKEYFEKAIEVDAQNIDNNYFYGEFLIEQKQYERALEVLGNALSAPKVTERPMFDTGRRTEIRELLQDARSHLDLSAAN